MRSHDDLRKMFDRDGDGDFDAKDLRELGKKVKRAQSELYAGDDAWDWTKFVRGLNPFKAIWWGKTLNTLYRNLIVFAIIGTLIFGGGAMWGWDNRPINFGERDRRTVVEFQVDQIGTHQLVVETDGAAYFDGKPVVQGMVPNLKSYGIHIKPKLAAFAGGGSDGIGYGGGLAVEFVHFHRFNLDALYMFPDMFGVGVSYDLYLDDSILKIQNTSIGLGALGSPSGDAGVYIYLTVAM